MRPPWAVGSHRQHGYLTPISYVLFALSTILCGASSFAAESEDAVNSRDLVSSYGHLAERYLPNFLGLDRSIIGRAPDDPQTLSNNEPRRLNIEAGQPPQFWTFKKSELAPRAPAPSGLPSAFRDGCPTNKTTKDAQNAELRKRQSDSILFVTLSTCDQPSPKVSKADGSPQQLIAYISTSSGNTKPDASTHDRVIQVIDGHGETNITDVASDVYIGINAPGPSDDFSGEYNYELTVSNDEYYTKFTNVTVSRFMDSDNGAAIIHTYNTTSCNDTEDPTIHDFWKNVSPLPYRIFVSDQDDPNIRGLTRSMCALKNHAQVQDAADINSTIIFSGDGRPQQQFFIKGLNNSTNYVAVIALEGTNGDSDSIGGGKINGGGTVWNMTTFKTKTTDTCKLLYGLGFCPDVAYAVPNNPDSIADLAGLQRVYNDYAQSFIGNFNKSLAQIACNTTASAQYSLAVTCDDCYSAYKDWLCAVTVPRCEDPTNVAEYLQPRNINQDDVSYTDVQKNVTAFTQSRNPLVDQTIKPGYYKELLPCEDLCHGLVRSCPAALGFSCPLQGHGLNYTYGKLENVGPDQWKCNFPGRNLINSAESLQSPVAFAILITSLVLTWLSVK